MAHVVVRNLYKKYGELQVVHGIDFEINDGEFVVLVGPSGCGKSTILRMVAGLEDATDGQILIGGAVVNERDPKDRDVAMVFQDYALYPHMTVAENMGFSLRWRGVAKVEVRSEFVVLVGPSGCGKSTILRMVAGLEDATDGQILIGGAVVNERDPKDRDVAMVFQDYALYPHMTVAENMGFSLRWRGVAKVEV